MFPAKDSSRGLDCKFAELFSSHQLTPVLMWSDLHSMSYLRLVIQDSKPILLANKNQHAMIVLGTTHQTKFIKINIEMFF